MADTALNEEEIIEYYDADEVLDNKIQTLAKYINEAKHTTVYTGAGISTSAGIPDFRGPDGVWTLRAKGLTPDAKKASAWNTASPTLCHMTLVQLQKVGKLQCVVSQNCDGLHLKSGIEPDKICELHGNCNVEFCAECGKVYYRSKRVRHNQNAARVTGRRCIDCKTPLRYTTVAFGQSMPDKCLQAATSFSRATDLAICMGTSMRVSPACELPVKGKKTNPNHKLVIINLQKTPYDDVSALRIFAKVDVVMIKLMNYLAIDIPNWEDLHLHKDEEWLQKFQENYQFRSAGVTDWFKGKMQLIDAEIESCLQK